jgi:putative oxidoreductase
MLTLRRLIHRVSAALSWLPPAVARLTLGWIFLESGWGKLHSLPKVVEYFRSLGIPAPEILAPFVASMEFLCGSLMLLGLATRLASLELIIIMVVALVTAKAGDIHELSDLFGTSEYLYIALALWLGAYGAGPLSLDAVIAKRLDRAGRPLPGTAHAPGR